MNLYSDPVLQHINRGEISRNPKTLFIGICDSESALNPISALSVFRKSEYITFHGKLPSLTSLPFDLKIFTESKRECNRSSNDIPATIRSVVVFESDQRF